MLSADRKQHRQQQAVKDAAIGGDRTDKDGDHTMSNAEDDEEDLYWKGEGEFTFDDVDIVESGGTYQRTWNTSRNAECREALITIVCTFLCVLTIYWNLIHSHSVQKKVTMISIMMQSTNQKCNALELVFGIFLHSCNTLQKVIQALAHMGLSISVGSIHSAVASLSRKAFLTLRAMGQTLLVGYAYDNLVEWAIAVHGMYESSQV
jgi:hypothetical protein